MYREFFYEFEPTITQENSRSIQQIALFPPRRIVFECPLRRPRMSVRLSHVPRPV